MDSAESCRLPGLCHAMSPALLLSGSTTAADERLWPGVAFFPSFASVWDKSVRDIRRLGLPGGCRGRQKEGQIAQNRHMGDDGRAATPILRHGFRMFGRLAVVVAAAVLIALAWA